MNNAPGRKAFTRRSELLWQESVARDWLIEGKYLEYCICNLGRPCHATANPTQGHCTGLIGFRIDEGECDGVKLDGLAVVTTFYFPRAMHHGQGVMQPIIDERADEEQRDALLYILSGADQEVGTMFQTFSVIVETVRDPVFAPIAFEWDLDHRRARIELPAAVKAQSDPLPNPMTDTDHRMVTVLPNGWAFHEAENVAGVARRTGPIRFNLNRRHLAMASVAWGPKGVVKSYGKYTQDFARM